MESHVKTILALNFKLGRLGSSNVEHARGVLARLRTASCNRYKHDPEICVVMFDVAK